MKSAEPVPAPSPRLTVEQARPLVSVLPHCKLVWGGRAVELLHDVGSAPPEPPYGGFLPLLEAYLVSLERQDRRTLLELRDSRRLKVTFSTPREGLTLADLQSARDLVSRWSLIRNFGLR